MKAPLLQVENLCVSFSLQGSEIQAVRGISFDLFPGEIVGIVGESGCGKSAAVQAIAGLSTAARIEGKVLFENQSFLDQKRNILGKQIGMVFQDPMASLNPTMKIGAQIMEGMLYHKMASRKAAKEKAIELLHLVGVSEPRDRLDQYPHQLSGGQRQRVLIAIALSCNPKLLIADEPTTALDVTIQAQILNLLKQMQSHFNTSLLLISHDFGVISSVCDRVLVFYAGTIVEQGPLDTILKYPRHPYTEMLLGSIPRPDHPKDEPLTAIEGAAPPSFEALNGCRFRKRCPYRFARCVEEPPRNNGVACWRAHD